MRETDPTATLPVVLYDGACRFCTAQAERVRRLARGTVAVLPLQTAVATLPWIDPDEAAKALTLVDEDGRVLCGAAAVVAVLVRARPALAPLARVYSLPPIRWLAERAYAFVAARRYTLFGRTPDHEPCDDGSCALPYRDRRG